MPPPAPTPFSNPTPVPGAPTIDPQGNRLFSPRTYAEGSFEYRIGQSEWFITPPPGMRVWWDFLTTGGGGIRWGWFDATSGSLLVVNGNDLTEIERILQGDAPTRAVASRNFDLLLASARRERPE